ncbi:AfsR/SARP family transcriptional regulator [Micromonospora sp. NPDC049230]|uniref:AfsR/SARP family transcriptional regulator n=1 Tax=Micromonospora sp. NPDC049230 TaxID=3155502 RepID=UPI0033F9520F
MLDDSTLGLNWAPRANGYAPHEPSQADPPLRYRMLGPVEVRSAGRWISLPQAKCRALLAVLLVNANQVVSTDALREQIWPCAAPRTADKLIQQYVHQVRRALSDPDGRQLCTRAPGYLLSADQGDLDGDRFTGFAALGERALADGDAETAANVLGRALALWRGPALADVPDTQATSAEANRLEGCRLSALEAWIEAELICGQHNRLTPVIETLVAVHPLREQLRVHLMLALFRSGRRADALEAFRDLSRTLDDELGLRPSAEAQELHQAILRDEHLLDRPSSSAVPVGAESTSRH